MLPGFLFHGVRIFEIISLIPIWGMLAWFVDLYQPATPPDHILYPFMASPPIHRFGFQPPGLTLRLR